MDQTKKIVGIGWTFLLLATFIAPFLPLTQLLGYRFIHEFSLAAFLLVALVLIGRGRFRRPPKAEFWWVVLPMILFTVWSGVSYLWADSGRAAVHHTLLWACYAAFYLVIRQAIDGTDELAQSLKVVALVVLVIGADCVVEFVLSRRLGFATFVTRYYPYSEMLVTLLPLLLVAAVGERSENSRRAMFISLVVWAAVVVVASRTIFAAGVITVISLIVISFLYYRRLVSVKRWLLLAGIAVAITFGLQLLPNADSERGLLQRDAGTNEVNVQNSGLRLFYWGMAAEGFKTSPLIGVGADNYFSNYKTLRERYSAAHPDNPMLEVIAETIPERAHNEYLQILCELGLVGGLFFAWLMAGVGYMFVAALRKRASLTTLGALAGIGAFLVSSFASSYSFRVPANGICFFFLIAVAAREVFAPGERDEVSVKRPLLVFAGVGVALAMLVFSSVRALSIYYFSNAQLCEDKELAAAEIDKAIALDPQEPMFRFYRGQQLYFSGEYDEAIPELRFAVDHGIGTSPAYFNLLAAEMLAGKDDESRRTFDEALRVYPRSVFLRTAYAAFLKRQGDDAGAEIEYSHAYAIDPNQARSWRLAHEKGLDRLAQTAGSDPNYLPVAELIPVDGPLALVNFQRR